MQPKSGRRQRFKLYETDSMAMATLSTSQDLSYIRDRFVSSRNCEAINYVSIAMLRFTHVAHKASMSLLLSHFGSGLVKLNRCSTAVVLHNPPCHQEVQWQLHQVSLSRLLS